MFRMRARDLALVAFAGGLLAIEVVGLRAVAPRVMRTVARGAGMSLVGLVSERPTVPQRHFIDAAMRAEVCRLRAHAAVSRHRAATVRRTIEIVREASAL